MKRIIAPLVVGILALTPLAFTKVEIKATYAIDKASLPTTIDLNDSSEEEIRSYYADLNSLSNEERQGTNLLKNLKPILKRNQKCFTYGSSATTAVWQAYEIVDRDWSLSPAKDIEGYDASTNKIVNYKYGTGDSSTNPYIHALYVNRDKTNGSKAWGDHTQKNYGHNQEHIWAKSLGFEEQTNDPGARGDLMHLWAGNGRVNGQYHNNFYYGYVDKTKDYKDAGNDYEYLAGNLRGKSKTFGGSNDIFEPQDADKGDIARALFYMVARYNFYSGSDDEPINSCNPNLEIVNDVTSWQNSGYTSSESSTGKIGILQDLLEWNRIDPPDEWEIHRNNLMYKNFSNNRNPFVDFPSWADYIWGTSSNGTYNTSPTGSANPTSDEISKGRAAPVTPSEEKGGLDIKTIIIIAAVAVVVLVILIIVFTKLSKKNKKKALKTVKKTVKKSTKKPSKKKK